jgi:hypothetical protein
LTATRLTIPLTHWTVLTNGAFDVNGNFSTTNAAGTNGGQFYILQLPQRAAGAKRMDHEIPAGERREINRSSR